MPIHHIQPSFVGGEVSPSLQARVDSAAYQTWLKSACNFYVHPQGGVSNRPGTVFMGQAKYAGKACRLLPFTVGENEAYVLELGKQYLRVYTSSGPLYSSGTTPYELTTPYQESDLADISYTQYDQTLFLAHPDYPLYRLKRLAVGSFELSPFPIKYGPFQLPNGEGTHQLRVCASQDGQETVGVAASLSFLPVVDSRYFVYGYFNDQLFFAARDYGLDLGQLVSDFNTTYSSQGLSATNSGGVLQITSPQATGGDWNGATLRLVYRDSFLHDPSLITEQVLSGGVNEGETVPSGEVDYILESDFDCFSPQHVGTRFSLTHTVESQYQLGTLGYESSSSTIKSASDWQVRTSGNWTGTLVLEKSEDAGDSWQAVKYFIRASGEDNITVTGTLNDKGEIYYLRLRACGITGEAGYELSSAAFVQQGIAVVENFVDERKVTVSLERGCGSEDWTSNWAEGSFGEKSGYPSCVFVYQDRLGLAGTRAEPQTVWFSKTGEYQNFGHARTTLEDADAISLNLSGKKLNAVHSVAAAGKLIIFTSGSEWILSSSGALTPYTVQLAQQGERGASRVPSVLVGNHALYVQARGSALRDFCYDYTSASYTGDDLTLCAKHLFANKEIKEMCYQQEPDNLLWCVLSDGMLASLTYVPEQQVCAWTHHSTQGYFRSVCAIANRGYDEIWFAVERDGHYYIEKLLQRLADKSAPEQVFLDASVSKRSDTAFSEVSGLEHLEGKTVGILADGNPLAAQVVSDGKITLPKAANCVHVGLNYQAQLQTLPAVFETSGVVIDKKRRIVGATLQFADSRGGLVGLANETAEEIIQRTDEPYNTPLALKTGQYEFVLSGQHTRMPSLVFTQQDPLPVTLLSISCRLA
ncbi:MAG: hypothetical protein MJ053_03815 [Elusimicrobiaceae bacterium]|nr:hypothetical protein [Elusimicrobiaceae bacterium]